MNANAIMMGVGSVLLLIVLGITLSTSANVEQNIQETMCDDGTYDNNGCWDCASGYSYNTSAHNCYNATNSSMTATATTAGGYAFNMTTDTLTGFENFSDQQSTIWLITAVGLIIAVLVGAFAYVNYKDM